ncbi:NYN domain-containing protein [Caproiciproducens sp. LBM24188]
MEIEKDNRFAVLIDADNVSEKYIKFILDEISNDGVATYKRIYGDWTKPALGMWKNVLLDYSITPIQQYSYTTGKNATDSAMIIDAMDILYSGNVDGFCIVSSDSDFTRLAVRLRESGMYVVGMGEKKTPNAFISACNKFRYLEVLAQNENSTATLPNTAEETTSTEMTPLETIKSTIRTIVQEISDDDGRAFVGELGNMLVRRYPDFDVRNYGFRKLTPLLKSMEIFDIYSEPNSGGYNKLVYVKEKNSQGQQGRNSKK